MSPAGAGAAQPGHEYRRNVNGGIAAQDALIEELYAEPETEAAEGAENAESAETVESEGADPAAESEAAVE